jgi:hypothetical protein
MKKSLFLIFAFVASFFFSYSQNLGHAFLNSYGSSDWETIAATLIDEQGNTYLCGSFSGTFVFGPHSKTSNGKRDIYVAKMDKDGNELWLQNYGDKHDENAYSIIEKNGIIYLVGSFKKQTQIGTFPLQAENFTDVFIAELDLNGNVSKAPKVITSPAAAQKVFLQKDPAGNIYLAGSFKKSIRFDDQELLTDGKTDLYYVKYNEQGNFENPKRIGGTEDDHLFDFKVSPQGDIYLACSFEGGLYELSSQGKADALLLKINNADEVVFKKQFGGTYNDQLKQIALDVLGNVYLAGEYEHALSIETTNYTTTHKKGVFLLQLDPTGNITWQSHLGDDAYHTISSLELATNNKFYIAGSYRGIFGNKPSAKNSKDAYIARYQTNGTQEWLIQAGHNHEDQLQLKSYPTGELFISGFFNNAFELKKENGDIEADLKDKNYKDLLLGKLVDCETMPGIDLGGDQTACGSLELSVEDNYSTYTWSNGQSTTNTLLVEESGTIGLEVTNDFGCTFNDEIVITIANDLIIDLGEDQTFCEGSSTTLTAGPADRNYLWNDGQTGYSREITESGTYTVTLNEENCTASDEIIIIVNPAPVVDLGPDVTASADTTIYIHTNLSYDEYSFSWLDRSSQPYLCVPMYKVEQLGGAAVIWVDVTSLATGCTTRDSVLVQVTPPVSMAVNNSSGENLATELSNIENNSIEYKIYPNPSTGKFFLSVSSPEKVKQVDVFDLRGNKIKTYQDGFAFPLEVDLTGKAGGTYLLKISELNSSKQFSIIIK